MAANVIFLHSIFAKGQHAMKLARWLRSPRVSIFSLQNVCLSRLVPSKPFQEAVKRTCKTKHDKSSPQQVQCVGCSYSHACVIFQSFSSMNKVAKGHSWKRGWVPVHPWTLTLHRHTKSHSTFLQHQLLQQQCAALYINIMQQQRGSDV